MIKQPDDKEQPMQRRHLQRLDPDRVFIQNPVYFITMNAYKKQFFFTDDSIARSIRGNFECSPETHGWAVGQYVIMPNHIHFLCRATNSKKSLSAFIRDFKRIIARDAHNLGIAGKLWQTEFFDRLLRNAEEYNEKKEYVRLNPVRANLVQDAAAWPWQGVIDEI